MARHTHSPTALRPCSLSAMRSLRLALSVVLIFVLGITLLPVAPAQAQVLSNTPRSDFWVTNGSVNALQQVGNTLYLVPLAGSYSSARLPPATNTLPLGSSVAV